MKKQEKRFEGIKEYHELDFRRKREGQFEGWDEGEVDKFVEEDFQHEKRFWLTILDTSINCLLDQG